MYNNKLLAAIFIGLFALYAITKVVKANRGTRTFKNQLAAVDTALVQSIVLHPQIEQHREIRFNRSTQGWIMQRGNLQALAQEGKLANLLNAFRDIKPQRLVAKNQSKWAEFQLTDSLATKITLFGTNGRQLTSLLVGKVNKGGVAFVRLPNENEVYAIDSYLGTNVNKPFNDWRNQDVINLLSNQVEKIEFKYDGDSSLVLEKGKEGWKMGDVAADSTLVIQYLNSIASKRSSKFDDQFNVGQAPRYVLTLSGKKMRLQPQIMVQGFESGNEVFLRSSLNPNAVFRSKKNELFAEIFKSKADFVKKKVND